MLPHIKCILSDMQTPLLKELYEELDTLEDLCKLVSDSIREDPPIAMKEGGIIKDGYNAEVDKLRKMCIRDRSLFAEVLIPDSSTVPEWEQPDSTNPYVKGDKVTHNGKTWISTADGNV